MLNSIGDLNVSHLMKPYKSEIVLKEIIEEKNKNKTTNLFIKLKKQIITIEYWPSETPSRVIIIILGNCFRLV